MLMAICLYSYANISSATTSGLSNFDIHLFNNTNLNQPLHYKVTSDNQARVEGILQVGDDHGKQINILGGSNDKTSAEIIVTDLSGHAIWDNKVSFWGSNSSFFTNTISLDQHYNVATSPYPSIHAIGFDVRSQS